MARVRNRDTAPEMTLRRALYAAGVRGWRCHPRKVPGRPDLAFIGRHVAVFVDGAFWHGHPEYYRGQSGPFWDEKIARNRARDTRVMGHRDFTTTLIYADYSPSEREREWVEDAFSRRGAEQAEPRAGATRATTGSGT